MNIKVTISNRSSKCHAEAEYSESGIVVKKGGLINLDFAAHIKGGKAAKSFREDAIFVSENGTILKDCPFSSPSTAAQFVTGRSTNGYAAWKVDKKTSLGKYLEANGLK